MANRTVEERKGDEVYEDTRECQNLEMLAACKVTFTIPIRIVICPPIDYVKDLSFHLDDDLETFEAFRFHGHAVVGVLRRGVVGVRYYGDLPKHFREHVEFRILAQLPSSDSLEVVNEPACIEHDDCASLPELGRACWRHHHPRG